MNTKVIITSAIIGSLIFAPQAIAAVFDRDKLAHALALRFNLNEKEVTYFLADFQYEPDKTLSLLEQRTSVNSQNTQPVAAAAPAISNPTSIPSPTPASITTNAPTTNQNTIVINGQNYAYDSYTDAYYLSSNISSIQHQNHLKFIEQKIDQEVLAGRINPDQKIVLMTKLAEMMKKSPSSDAFSKMSTKERNSALKQYKREMSDFLERRGMSLEELQRITGKGAQYLMGIYLEA